MGNKFLRKIQLEKIIAINLKVFHIIMMLIQKVTFTSLLNYYGTLVL
jgi:hypothetical protein